MDSRATKEKLSEGKRVAQDEDVISKMPDLILGRILSFLSTKEAVRTCVLSTRWIPIWRFINNIHLDDRWINSKTETKNAHFKNVCNRMIHLHNNPTIESFSLLISSDNKYDPSQINEWITGVSGKSIQKLHIKYTADEVFPSLFALFDSNTMVHMVLDMNCSLRVPATSISMSNLQYLKLKGVVFLSDFGIDDSDDEIVSDSDDEIVFSFPVLKVFEAEDYEWFEDVCIEAPQLESITLVNPKQVSRKSVIRISANQIQNFYVYGDLMNHDIIADPSSMTNCSAHVFILCKDYPVFKMHELGFRICVLLALLNEAEELKLGSGTVRVLAHARDCLENCVPEFQRLISLRLEGFTAEILFDFLNKSPVLKTLILQSVAPFDEGILSSEVVPGCLLYSLEVAMILEFKGDEHEIRLAKYFLGNAAILEDMVISTCWMWDSDPKLEKVKERVVAFPKLSSIAEVDFVINVRGETSMETSAYGNSILQEALGLI